jgi:hypothetical protein
LGFAVTSQLAARARPRCRFVFLRSKVRYALLSASPRGYALRFATVGVITSVKYVSTCKTQPMLGTLAQAATPAGPRVVSAFESRLDSRLGKPGGLRHETGGGLISASSD